VGWYTWEVLQVLRPVCYANYTYFTPYNSTLPLTMPVHDKAPRTAALEWFGHAMMTLMTVTDFDALVNGHAATWVRGVSYGTSIGYFPHSIQALLPILNAPLLGWSIDQFVYLHFSPSVHGGRTWQWLFEHFNKHSWVSQLLPLLLNCLGVTFQLGDESFYHEFTHRAQSPDRALREAPAVAPEPIPGQILCFETLLVPNNTLTCDRTFVDDTSSPALWNAFRQSVHRSFGIPSIPSTSVLRNQVRIRIGYLARAHSRRILNAHEAIAAISRVTGAPVKVFTFEKGLRLDMQVRIISQFNVLVAVHGANLMNALFLHAGAVVVEIFLLNWSIPCYYGPLLRRHGVPYRAFCAPAGRCVHRPGHRQEYPRADAAVDPTALAAVVQEEVEKTRRRLLVPRTPRPGRRRTRAPEHLRRSFDTV